MRKEQYDITGMTCAACSARIEKSVGKLSGMNEVAVNLLKNSMTVTYDDSVLSTRTIIDTVVKAGYGASLKDEAKGKSTAKKETVNIAKEQYEQIKKRLILSIVFTVPLSFISMGHMFAWPFLSVFSGDENAMVLALTLFLLVIPVVFINFKFFRVGYRTLLHGSPNMDTLIALGSSAAVVYGIYAMYKIAAALGAGDWQTVHQFAGDLYFESAGMILTLITFGKFLEARAKGKTSDAITKLMNLAPKTAVVERDGREEEIAVEDLAVGDIVIIRAGQSVPTDGTITEGTAAVDESAITGESIPAEKSVNDKLIGATVLKSGFVKMQVQSVGEDTALAQIIHLVDEATSSKAPIAQMADKVSGVFVPIVIAVAVLTMLVWLFIGESFEFALTTAIAVLVISCPCALGLATPTAIMVGTGRGATNGILIKSAQALETLHSIKTVVLDKTGTVTQGTPSVTDIIHSDKISAEDFLQLAASLENYSEHPLAKAIVAKAQAENIPLLPAQDFSATAGSGVQGTINGKKYSAGNRKVLSKYNLYNEPLQKWEKKLAQEGKTPLFFVQDGEFIGIIALADTIKPTSYAAIAELKQMGIDTVMLTGDNAQTAQAVQKAVKVDKVIAEVLPQDKAGEVQKLQQSGKTAMVGDGINDAPALAQADVGIAIGAGTDIAIEAADLVLMKNKLTDVVGAIQLSKAVITNIKENLFWALFYNVICIPIAAGVFYPAFGLKLSPVIGALAMSFSSVFVVSNALRLRFFRPKYAENINHAQNNDSQQQNCHTEAVSIVQNINQKSNNKKDDVKMKKKLTIEGMMCQNCVKHVTKALQKLDGVAEVEVSLEQKSAVVTMNNEIADDVLSKAITDMDYEVVKIETV